MRKLLIHLLGGVTKKESSVEDFRHYDLGCYNTADMFKRFADQMNGVPADDWCRLMYAHIEGYLARYDKIIHKDADHEQA